MRVLLVGDNALLTAAIKRNLQLLRPRWSICEATCRAQALNCLAEDRYDAALVDCILGETPAGLELCAEVRKKDECIALIMLSAECKIEVRVTALDAGVDDFVSKNNLNLADLCTRVELAALRPRHAHRDYLRAGALSVFRRRPAARVHGQVIELNCKQWAMLMLLAQWQGQTVSPARLCEACGLERTKDDESLHSEMARLRQRLGPLGFEAIQRLASGGYRLESN